MSFTVYNTASCPNFRYKKDIKNKNKIKLVKHRTGGYFQRAYC